MTTCHFDVAAGTPVMVIWYTLANSHNKFRCFGDCTATFISDWPSVNELRELASAYQVTMTHLPSHSGLYKGTYSSIIITVCIQEYSCQLGVTVWARLTTHPRRCCVSEEVMSSLWAGGFTRWAGACVMSVWALACVCACVHVCVFGVCVFLSLCVFCHFKGLRTVMA